MQEAIKDLKMSLRMWGRKPQKESYENADAFRRLAAGTWKEAEQGN